MALIPENERLPIQPLLDYIERKGGVDRLAGFGVWSSIPSSGDAGREQGRIRNLQLCDRTDEEQRSCAALRQLLAASEERGWIPLHKADEIACDVLQVHPMAVWGMAWFGEPITKSEERWVDRWAREDTYADRREGMAA